MADYYDLGSYVRTVTTTSPEAQRWFDRGLVWCYGFHHEEAVRCFERAIAADPGLRHGALGHRLRRSGPTTTSPGRRSTPPSWPRRSPQAHAATARGAGAAGGATPVEQALIAALAARYPPRRPCDDCSRLERRLCRRHARGLRGVPRRPRRRGAVRRGAHEPHAVAAVGHRDRRAGRRRRHARGASRCSSAPWPRTRPAAAIQASCTCTST